MKFWIGLLSFVNVPKNDHCLQFIINSIDLFIYFIVHSRVLTFIYWFSECKDLIRRMLSVDPVNRIPAEEILTHAWFARIISWLIALVRTCIFCAIMIFYCDETRPGCLVGLNNRPNGAPDKTYNWQETVVTCTYIDLCSFKFTCIKIIKIIDVYFYFQLF